MPAVTLTNSLAALNAATALVTLAMEALMASERFRALVETARGEGRDLTDAELDALRTESNQISANLSSRLRGE